MIKQITNLNTAIIETNRIVNGSKNIYRNEVTNEIKTGQTLLYKFSNILLDKISKVANAKLLIPCSGNGVFEIGVFRNTATYVSSLVQGNNEPTYDTSSYVHYEKFTLGKSALHHESRLIEIDLTNLFARWKSESVTNLSFTLRCTSTATLTVYSPNHPDLSGKALFSLSYADTNSYSPAFDYLTDEVSFGGTALVNTLTGRLAHQFDIFQTKSKKFPIKFSVNYIERLSDVTMKNSLIGNWRTNFDYGFKIEANQITIVSPEGSISYFEKTLKEDAAKKYEIVLGTKPHCFVNQIDNSYIVEDSIIDGFKRYKMHDSNKSIFTFNSNNNVISIEKEDGAMVIFGYDSATSTNNKVTSITSSDGYKVVIIYSGMRVEHVNFIKENRRISFKYQTEASKNGIASITLAMGTCENSYVGIPLSYFDLFTTSFEHSNSRLTKLANKKTLDGLLFYYSGEKVIRVNNIAENGYSYVITGYRNIEYFTNYTKISDFENNVQYVTHDSYGMLQQRIDNEGNSVSLKHKSVGIDGLARRVSNDSGLIPVAKNRLLDHSFEILGAEGITTNSRGWRTDNKAAVTTSEDGVYGRHALSIKKTSSESAQVVQHVFQDNGSYTLEFFVKTKNIIGSAKVIAKACGEQPSGYIFTNFESESITSAHSKWTKITISNIIINDYYGDGDGWIEVIIDGSHTGGELLVDDIRLAGETNATNENMILSGDMGTQSGVPDNFIKVNCGANDIGIYVANEELPYSKVLGGNRFRFDRAQGITKKIEREIPLYGASGEEFTFAFWGKSQFNNGSSLKGKVELKKGGAVVQTEIVEAEKTLINWQLISVSLTTKRPYDSIKLIIEYTGINQAFIDSISLFRDNFGTHYNYNEKGNLLEEANNASSKSLKTNGAKVVESNNELGEQYQYSYDSKGRVTKITDAKNNVVNLEYDSRGNQIKSRITSNEEVIEFSNTFNSNDLATSSTDEMENTTSFTYDITKKLKTKTEANGLITANSYDELSNLFAIVKSGQGISLSASYEYNNNNTLSKIICDNGTSYEFIYDNIGRMTEIRLNNQTLVSYQYGLYANSLSKTDITRQIMGSDIYDFKYDTKFRLSEVRLNSVLMTTYEYDSASNISKKTSGDSVSYFDYDSKGNLVRETRENEGSLSYDFDNLEQLQKIIIDINDMSRSYDFEYLNEYNEYNSENLKDRIDKTYSDDIIDFNALNSGMYGAKAQSVWGSKVKLGDKNLFRLNKMTSKIIYPLDSINSTRNQLTGGGAFNTFKWKSDFEDCKSMFGWFRFTGVINSGHKIFAFGNDTTDNYYVTLAKSGTSFVFTLYSNGASLGSRTIPATNDLIFIGLKLSRAAQEGVTSHVLTINDMTISGISYSTWISKLTKFVLGNRAITTGSMTENLFIQDVSLISIGAFNHSNTTFQSIREEETRFKNINLKPKTGVSFVNQKTYEGFEVMSLNGTFKSNLGRTPVDYEFIDGTYKLDKTKLFKYDEALERHVYGSYSSAQGLGLVKGLLTYKHDLTKSGTISLNFKLSGISSGNRTVLDFRSENTSVLKAYRNASGNLVITANGIGYATSHVLSLNQWHRILITYDNNGITTYLNDESVNHEVKATINLTNTKLVIGSSIDAFNRPIEHLNGDIEMLGMMKDYLKGNTNRINNVVKGEQQLSVKTETDVLGRSARDIIDTGIVIDIAQGMTKKLTTKYEYKSPKPGHTSLQVLNTESFDGNTRYYRYDNMGNITGIEIEDSMSDIDMYIEYKYQYDVLSRLIREFNPETLQTILYFYDYNNNISKVEYYTGDGTTNMIKRETYNYDKSYRDKLLSISTLENGLTTTKTISYSVNHVPTSFMGKALKWQGRRLTNINETISYTYNDASIRTSKTVNGVTTNYHLIGDKVGSLSKGSDKLFFHYNERDMLVGFEYDMENYFYHRDLMGVITSIVDKNEEIVVTYLYDAWGNWLNKEDAAQTPIGKILVNLNPFIYKGYIYDEESGFYYLKSRYYSPEVRRFINIDVEIADIGEVNGYNLYAYCFNNPVLYADLEGNRPKWLKWVIAGAAIVAAVAVVTVLCVTTGGVAAPIVIGALIGAGVNGVISATSQHLTTGKFDLAQFMLDVSVGAIVGAFGGSAFGVLANAIVGGTVGVVSSIGADVINDRPINWAGAAISGTIGFILGAASKGVQHGKLGDVNSARSALGTLGKKSVRGYGGLRTIWNNKLSLAMGQLSNQAISKIIKGLGRQIFSGGIAEAIKIIIC